MKTNDFRKLMNLRPIRKGKRKCLKCEKTFMSEDLDRVYKCYNCRYQLGIKEEIE